MSKSERKYSVTRQELLAAVTFIHHFRQFLLGQHFVLCTNGSLQWLHSFKEPEGQLVRWLERLQEYDFDIQHRKGSHHQNADALSRHPAHQPDCSPIVSDVNAIHIMQNDCPHILSSVTTEPFPELQRETALQPLTGQSCSGHLVADVLSKLCRVMPIALASSFSHSIS